MARSTGRAVFAGPKGIDETELLSRIKDLARSGVHWTEDLRGLVDTHKVVYTPYPVSIRGRKGAEMIFHCHRESTETAAVPFTHGHVNEDVYVPVNKVFETFRFIFTPLPGSGDLCVSIATAPSIFNPAPIGQIRKRGCPSSCRYHGRHRRCVYCRVSRRSYL